MKRKILGALLTFFLTGYSLFAQDYPEMVVVQGGSYIMGDDASDKDEKPAHPVTVTTFSIAKTETTVAQWEQFCQATGRRMPEAPWFGLKAKHPIVNVSWDDAVAYCLWLGGKTGKHCRLPTEAGWSSPHGVDSKVKDFNTAALRRLIALRGSRAAAKEPCL